MKFLRWSIVAVSFFIAILLRDTFLPYVSISGVIPDLVFALFFVLIFFTKEWNFTEGFFLSVLAGFFLDVVSPSYFGISITFLLLVFLLQKAIDHFSRANQNRFLVLYFSGTFTVAFFVYNLLWWGVSFLLSLPEITLVPLLTGWMYTLPFALILFFISSSFFAQDTENQLKLFV